MFIFKTAHTVLQHPKKEYLDVPNLHSILALTASDMDFSNENMLYNLSIVLARDDWVSLPNTSARKIEESMQTETLLSLCKNNRKESAT